MNSRGLGEAMMLFSFIFIIFIMAVGIIWGSLSFAGNFYDGRYRDAFQLGSIVKSCISEKDFFASSFNLSSCGLEEGVLTENYLVYVTSSGKSFSYGVADYVNQCSFIGARENKNYPKCISGVVSKGSEEINYLIGVNQKPKRYLNG